MTRTVAIISALEEEAAHIADACTNVREEHRASLAVLHGELTTDAGDPLHVVIAVGGMGLVNAAATTQYLIDCAEPDAVIFSGIAGNLNPELHINDIVLGGTLRYLDTDMRLVGQWKPGTPEFHSDPQLIALAQTGDGALLLVAAAATAGSRSVLVLAALRRRPARRGR